MKKKRAPLLGSMDEKVWNLVKGLRIGGSVINASIIESTIRSVVSIEAPHLLSDVGGPIDPSSRSLRQSFYRRHNMVIRRATSTRKQMTAAEVTMKKQRFIREVNERVDAHNIPDALIINWDETSLPVMPTDDFTMEVRGTRTVKISGQDDKRNVTGVVGSARDGAVLPGQVLYAGKTVRCHPPSDSFPDQWDVWHTAKHWSTSSSKARYVLKVILEYVRDVRERLGLVEGSDHALVIFDYHRSNTANPPMYQLFDDNRILWQLVPSSMTDHCQVLNL